MQSVQIIKRRVPKHFKYQKVQIYIDTSYTRPKETKIIQEKSYIDVYIPKKRKKRRKKVKKSIEHNEIKNEVIETNSTDIIPIINDTNKIKDEKVETTSIDILPISDINKIKDEKIETNSTDITTIIDDTNKIKDEKIENKSSEITDILKKPVESILKKISKVNKTKHERKKPIKINRKPLLSIDTSQLKNKKTNDKQVEIKKDKEYVVSLCKMKCKCGRKATYTSKYATKYRCRKCKTDDMIYMYFGKCCICRKNEGEYINKNDGFMLYCDECKDDDMMYAFGQCIICHDWPDPRKAEYGLRGHCKRCFIQYFPNDPIVYKLKTERKEIIMRNFINMHFDSFIHDMPMYSNSCKCIHRRRIDFRKQIGNTCLAIECDENMHKSYNKDDESIRYNDLMIYNTSKWIFIRVNVDKYSVNGETKNPDMNIRLETLKKEMNKQISRIKKDDNTELLEIIYLYYDEYVS